MKNQTEPRHLLDGEPVYLVHMRTPQERRRSRRTAAEERHISPVVDAMLDDTTGGRDGFPPRNHFTGEWNVIVRLVDGRTIMCPPDRLAHARTCPDCEQTWKDADRALRDTPPGGLRTTVVSLREWEPTIRADLVMADAHDLMTDDDTTRAALSADELAMYLVTVADAEKRFYARDQQNRAYGQAAATKMVVAVATAVTGRAPTAQQVEAVTAAVDRVDARLDHTQGGWHWTLDTVVRELSTPVPAGRG